MAIRIGYLAALAAFAMLFVVSSASSEDDVACTAATATALVQTFVRNYDNGRVPAMDRQWAQAPGFQWFSTRAPGARLGAAAKNRSTLVPYFRTRVRVHENLRVTKLGGGYDPQRNLLNFAGKLVRRADDLPARAPQDFKGAAECRAGAPLLIVWSM
ncbi:MAG: hypothetical protein ACJ76I_02085 [Gaiellaceae bacterium]